MHSRVARQQLANLELSGISARNESARAQAPSAVELTASQAGHQTRRDAARTKR